MDGKRIVILVLVVVAILCAMALGAGAYQAKRDKSGGGNTSVPGFVNAIGRLFVPQRTTLDSARLKPQTGCLVSGAGPGASITVGPVPCSVVIDAGTHATPQVLRLAPPDAPQGYACYKLSAAAFDSCPAATPAGDEKFKFKGATSFSVGRDSAFLRLYCEPVPAARCVFTLR